jgi:hypothetical protein
MHKRINLLVSVYMQYAFGQLFCRFRFAAGFGAFYQYSTGSMKFTMQFFVRDALDRKSTRLNSSHYAFS